MRTSTAEIVREYGPFPGAEAVHGVSFDGERIWFAAGDRVNAVDPDSGDIVQSFDAAAHAGTAFNGEHLYQVAENTIQKLDPRTGAVLATIASPGNGASGLAYADGTLWVGEYRARKIHQVDPDTGAVLRSIQSDRFVTGVTWANDDLWHGTWEGDDSDLRRIDPETGEVLETIVLPSGMMVSGMEADGGDRLYCGGGGSGKICVIRRPM